MEFLASEAWELVLPSSPVRYTLMEDVNYVFTSEQGDKHFSAPLACSKR